MEKEIPALPIWALVCILDALIPIQLPANGLEKAAENGQRFCAPATQVGDPDESS